MDIPALYHLFLEHPSVQTDTRKLRQGDLFFALRGPSFNGNEFAKQALDAGASYVVIDEPGYAVNEQCILVHDVLLTLQQLAKYHREQFDIPFIAITGSNGKTTTKELITTVLKKRFTVYATEGNLNNHIGVPLTLLKIKKDAGIAVIEMGANHLKEIESYCSIALPGYGIITNCGKAHIEGFGSIEGVRKGKGELYDFLREHDGCIFRNADLDYLVDMAKGIGRQISYGSAESGATYRGRVMPNDVFLKIAALGDSGETVLDAQLVGAYNFPNVMAAVAVGLYFEVPMDDIKQAIAAYNPDNSRSQLMQRGSNKIILDAYNANPASMNAAISNFASLELPGKTLWIGAMKEMGKDEEREHRELLELIGKYAWDDVILVGKEFKGLEGTYRWFENSADAADYVRLHAPVNSSILIKGSRGSRMELMLAALEV